MIRRFRWIAAIICIAIAVPAVCFIDMLADDYLCAPPNGASSFEEMKPRLEMREPVWLVSVDGETFVVVFGNMNPLNQYRAGYLFDLEGKLRWWSADANRLSEKHKFWSVARLGNDAGEMMDGQSRKYGQRRQLGTVGDIIFPIADATIAN